MHIMNNVGPHVALDLPKKNLTNIDKQVLYLQILPFLQISATLLNMFGPHIVVINRLGYEEKQPKSEAAMRTPILCSA